MRLRVLHLLDLRDDAVEACIACRAAISVTGVAHRVLGIGTTADAAAARARGIPVDGHVLPAGPCTELASRRMKRLIADRDGRDASRPWADVVQCWSPHLLGLARLASGQRTPPRVCALLRPPVYAPTGFERARLEFGLRFATTFTFDRHVRRTWAELVSARRGGSALEQDIRLLSPPVTTGGSPARRAAARRRLGLRDGDVAIGLLADPPAAGAAAAFAFVLGLLFTTGAGVVGVVHKGDPQLRRAARFVRMHGRRWGLLQVGRLDGESNPIDGCDLAVWMGDDTRAGVWRASDHAASGPLAILDTLGRGVPVVMARHPITQNLFSSVCTDTAGGQLRDSLVARDGTLNALADRLVPLVHDHEHRARIGGLARGWVRAPVWGDAFEDDLPRLWREVTNTPDHRPGLPAPLASLEGAA